MRYQPIMLADTARDYVGKHWTALQRRSFMTIVTSHSPSGCITCCGVSGMTARQEFEYWFGKNADEFLRLLSYPKIKELCSRKQAVLRLMRSKRTKELKSA